MFHTNVSFLSSEKPNYGIECEWDLENKMQRSPTGTESGMRATTTAISPETSNWMNLEKRNHQSQPRPPIPTLARGFKAKETSYMIPRKSRNKAAPRDDRTFRGGGEVGDQIPVQGYQNGQSRRYTWCPLRTTH